MGYAKICEEIKRDKCPEPRKRKKKSETRGKNGQVSEVELGVQRYPPEWKKMDMCPTVELGVQDTHLSEQKKKSLSFSSQSFKKQGRYVSPQRAKVELDFHHCYHHHHHTLFIRHKCTS